MPVDDVRAETRALAGEIATKQALALWQGTRAENQSLDVIGVLRWSSLCSISTSRGS
jgi:hypothetical protein